MWLGVEQLAVDSAVSKLREYRVCRGTHLVHINRGVQGAAQRMDIDDAVDVLQERLVPLVRALATMLPASLHSLASKSQMITSLPPVSKW